MPTTIKIKLSDEQIETLKEEYGDLVIDDIIFDIVINDIKFRKDMKEIKELATTLATNSMKTGCELDRFAILMNQFNSKVEEELPTQEVKIEINTNTPQATNLLTEPGGEQNLDPRVKAIMDELRSKNKATAASKQVSSKGPKQPSSMLGQIR